MFHPHFLNLFFGNPHSMADTMHLISAFKVEEDLQQAWMEEREREDARAREKSEVSAADYNRKADGPYKEELYHWK